MKADLYPYLESTPVDLFQYFETIGSTNDAALEWAEQGAGDYALVVADEQTRGRGRFNRRWVSRPGSSLAFSLILKPTEQELEHLALFSPLCGLAVHRVLRDLLGLQAEIKWPNDVLIGRRKVCGILVEASWTGDRSNGVVLGIGINITADSVPASEDTLFPATSLETACNCSVDRFAVLREVIIEIQKLRPALGQPEFIAEWQEQLAFKGELVRIEGSHRPPVTGRLKGVDGQGHLVIHNPEEGELRFEIGDVHLRPGE